MDADSELERILQRKAKELQSSRQTDLDKAEDEGYGPMKLSDQNFDKYVRRKSLAIVDFWAEWCGPCRDMLPVFERLAKRYGDRVLFGRVNVDEYGNLASRYEVYGIPTFIIFHNGVPADRIVGAVGEQGLERLLVGHLKG